MVKTARRTYAPRLPPDERRTQILDVTLGIVARSGYAAVTMEAVAAEAGVAKPVVYGLFANRTDLLWALLDREEKLVLSELSRLLPQPPWDDNPAERLVDSAVAVFRAVADNPPPWRVILEPASVAVPEEVLERIAAGRSWLIARVEEILRWAIAQSGGPQDADSELAARAALSLAENAARLVLADPENFPPERLGEFARRVVTRLQLDPE
jgi:AcrR family transcriptional regulator